MKKNEKRLALLLTAALATSLTLNIVLGVKAAKLEQKQPAAVPTSYAAEPTKAPEAVEPTPAPQETFTPYEDAEAVELIGRTIWGEAMGVRSKAERAAVAWCILNRADSWGMSIKEVVTAPRQFHGYIQEGTCPKEHLDLAADVLARWAAEKNGADEVGRTLPSGYLYFVGDGERNHFSVEYRSTNYWDWSLTDPYIK